MTVARGGTKRKKNHYQNKKCYIIDNDLKIIDGDGIK